MEKQKLFEIDNVCKNFNGHPALKNVSMHVNCGEIVGLVGENGAGKSTLLKIIMGVEMPTSGDMQMRGKKFRPQNPKEANNQGVGMVFQEQSLITNLTIAQNIFFGDEAKFKKHGVINYKQMNEQAEKALKAVDITNISPKKYVRDINFAARQMVEIAKVVNQANTCDQENAVVLLDEPTSVLNDAEVEQLFSEMRKLAANGHAIIFVSHRLDEVLKISERIYVFKDAQNAGEFVTSDTTETMLYEAMVGKSSTSEYYYTNMQREPEDDVVLEVKNLGLFGFFKDVSFKLKKGEILGFCGVIGSGKEELCYTLCGDLKPTAGEVCLKGKSVKLNTPADALKAGVLMIPQERNTEGIVGSLNIIENISASNLPKVGKLGIVSRKKLFKQAEEWIKNLHIKTSGAKSAVGQLSGGNMQKVVFARMLASESEIVLLNHPTRGVDVGAKNEIYHLIREMVDAGRSMILLGDTLDECIEMSNRVLVMMDGKIAGEFAAPVGGKPKNLDVIQCMM
jgi:ribose transport system ATP-binding protein